MTKPKSRLINRPPCRRAHRQRTKPARRTHSHHITMFPPPRKPRAVAALRLITLYAAGTQHVSGCRPRTLVGRHQPPQSNQPAHRWPIRSRGRGGPAASPPAGARTSPPPARHCPRCRASRSPSARSRRGWSRDGRRPTPAPPVC
jgi:hypothetical protein